MAYSALPIKSKNDADELVQVKIADGATPAQMAKVSSGGSIQIALSDPSTPSQQAVVDANGSLQLKLADATTPSQTAKVDANGSLQLKLADATTPSQTAAVDAFGSVSTSLKDGSGVAISGSNPLPVTAPSPGSSVNDNQVSASVAAGDSGTQDYTVTAGKTLSINQLVVASKGPVTVELRIETGVASNVFNEVYVGITPNGVTLIQPFPAPFQVAAGVRVRRVISNNDTGAQSLFSLLSGFEA